MTNGLKRSGEWLSALRFGNRRIVSSRFKSFQESSQVQVHGSSPKGFITADNSSDAEADTASVTMCRADLDFEETREILLGLQDVCLFHRRSLLR